ncbi:CPBP family intramembrane glutamic endopeptidase [Methanobrevibacter millerae]|uniref:CPBP family intramembrane glutamic endopeptidase n=1 Tax=Methanobrevibacter millerae TaxID=230361 RepID=UPI00122C1609|nr:type II CAAX endopeptidase family protein [Methanobrevibacter millerae]
MNEDKRFFSRIGISYLVMAILAIIFQTILAHIVSGYNPSYLKDYNVLTIISSFSNYILVLPIFVYMMGKLESDRLEKKSLGVKKYFEYVCITITLMWIGNLAGTIITTLIGFKLGNGIVNPVEQVIENSSIYINVIIISIIAPIFEEYMFRKMLIDRTIKYGAKLSILLSALLFALYHGNLSQFFYAFMLGGFFAYVYIKTGKIIYPITLHLIINLFGSVIATAFSNAMENVMAAATMANMADIAIVAAYLLVFIVAIIIGVYTLIDNYKIELNDDKQEIYLEKPFRTVILNFGMICFILFHIWKILMSFF